MVGKKGAKKSWRCGCGGCNEFPRPHYPQFGCRQASTSPSVSLELTLPPCSCTVCTHSTQFLMCPCHLSHLALILLYSESIRIQVLDDFSEYIWITQMPVFLSAIAWLAADVKVLVLFFLWLIFSDPRSCPCHSKKKLSREKQDVQLILISPSSNRGKNVN